jgi:Arc/MetJ-type ribon-helix-helix transcriptional regulator
MTSGASGSDARSLKHGEVLFVVNNYIVVVGGYLGMDDGNLGRFTYQSLRDFFPEYCDVEFPLWPEGATTREAFIQITLSLTPPEQARVLRGILKRFPVTARAQFREQHIPQIKAIIERLEGIDLIHGGDLKSASEVVRAALQDAQALIESGGSARAVDRMHTALHGYLISICQSEEIEVGDQPTIGALLRAIRLNHPRFAELGTRSNEVTTILNSFGSIAGVLNPIRNNASPAHPNDELLEEPEAWLVINACRAIYLYLDKKLTS